MDKNMTDVDKISKISEMPDIMTEIIYSSDSDCEYRLVRNIVRIKKDATMYSSFHCNYCPKQFLRYESLDAHLRRLHPNQSSQEITNMPDIVSIVDKDNLFHQEQKTNNHLIDKCKLCNEPYLVSEIAKHAKVCPVLNTSTGNEEDATEALCKNCGELYIVSEIEKHVNTCSSADATVEKEENIDSDNESDMQVETLEMDPDETTEEYNLTEECNRCGEIYVEKEIAEHIKVCPAFNKIHGENDIIIGLDQTMGRCHKCNEIYVLADIEQHVKVCKEAQSITFEMTSLCPICGKIFQTHKLKGHMKVHGEKTFLCTICGKGCVSSTALKVHFQSHTKEYRHECDLCKKKFSTKHTLKEHLRIHTGLKEFACKVCAKSFTQQNGLKQHMVHCHTGIKKLACDYCEKRFHKNSDLKEHLKVHTKERSYSCHTCGAQFIHCGSLRKHTRKFHSNSL